MNVDTRLIGKTAENVFLALINRRGVFATSFDTEAFDVIIFDQNHTLFKRGGKSPYYTQIKCRGSNGKFNSQGHAKKVIQKIKQVAKDLGIDKKSVYFTVGFFKSGDIRTLQFYTIPLSQLERFKGKNSGYRFSVEACEQAIKKARGMIKIPQG
jgi:hypothetical protein